MDAEQPSRVIFRLHRKHEDGTEITEEREVECDPDRMRELLCSPWDTAPRAEEVSPEQTINSLAQAVTRAFSDLELVVRETREPAERTWSLGFRRASDGDDSRSESVHAPDKEGGPVRMQGQMHLQVRGDEGPDVTWASGEERLRVVNHGLSIMNLGNVYAILNLQLNVDIQPEATDGNQA